MGKEWHGTATCGGKDDDVRHPHQSDIQHISRAARLNHAAPISISPLTNKSAGPNYKRMRNEYSVWCPWTVVKD